MSITTWEPFREAAHLQNELGRLFDNRIWRWRPARNNEEELSSAFMPAVDVFEDADAIVMTAELPGIEPKDVDLRVENNVLTVKGERKIEREDKKENYLRIERNYGTFSRSFTLPSVVEPDKIKADFKNGVLKITLPRREETKPKSIKVKVE